MNKITFDDIYENNGKLDRAYIVHAFGTAKAITIQGLSPLSSQQNRKPYIDLSRYPERIKERDCLSCSLIQEEKHTDTWGPAGIIIRVRAKDIVATSTSDIGTHQSAATLKAQKSYIQKPDELLTGSGYNEIVIDPEEAEIIGFFVKTYNDGIPVDPAMAKIAEDHAKRLGLPCRKLEKFDPFFNNIDLEIIDNPDGPLAVIKGDTVYQLYRNDGTPTFQKSNRKTMKSEPISELDLTLILGILEENGFGDNRLACLRDDFQTSIEKSKIPRLVKVSDKRFSLNFTIKNGRTNYAIDVNDRGSAIVTNLDRLQESTMATMAAQTQVNMFNTLVFASPAMVEKLLKQALPYAEKHNPEIAESIKNILCLDLKNAFEDAIMFYTGTSPNTHNTFEI